MSSPCILVADEDIDTRIILRTLLERHGFNVVEAASPDEALAHAGERVFDLVILNHPMVTKAGRSLVQHLRTDFGVQLPILNITSRVIPQFLEEAMLQGVTMTLPKPIDVEQVVNVVRNLTAQSLTLTN